MIGLGITLRNSRLSLIKDAIDLDADEYNTAKFLLYSGIRPVTEAEPDEYDNILLGEFALSWPCGSISNGVLTFVNPDDIFGLANGIAVWGRLLTVDDIFVMDLSVSNYTGSGDIKIDSTSIILGEKIHCQNFSITEGNA
jgi:hypothetical protein